MRRLGIWIVLVVFSACAQAESAGPDAMLPGQIDAANPTITDARIVDAAVPVDAPPQGMLTVTSPNGGETFTAGDVETVSWTSTGITGGVDIELHRGAVKVADLATVAITDGSYSWTLPTDLPSGADYRIVVRHTSSAVSDNSDANFAIANWQFRASLTFASGTARTNFPMSIELTPATFNYGNAAADGSDLRFATDTARTSGFDVPHYVDVWNPAGTSRVWVLVPSLTAGGADTIQLFYGNPAAASTSDMAATFPTQYNSTDGATLNTTYTVDLFHVQAGHTVNTPSGSAVAVNARLVIVEGTINGQARGASGGGGPGAGSGSGGGGGSDNAGAGGGGHGGTGGLGGYDTNDTPGTRGPTYGVTNSTTITTGSGGGGPSDVTGGNGGGAVELRGRRLRITGTLDMDGADGVYGTITGRGSGGGSGGGILLLGYNLELSGTLTARGGAGGTHTSTSSDGGGGGGGGRIKLFYQNVINNTATVTAAGGTGGNFGDVASGENGNTGTIHTGTTSTGEPTVTLGAQQTVF